MRSLILITGETQSSQSCQHRATHTLIGVANMPAPLAQVRQGGRGGRQGHGPHARLLGRPRPRRRRRRRRWWWRLAGRAWRPPGQACAARPHCPRNFLPTSHRGRMHSALTCQCPGRARARRLPCLCRRCSPGFIRLPVTDAYASPWPRCAPPPRARDASGACMPSLWYGESAPAFPSLVKSVSITL